MTEQVNARRFEVALELAASREDVWHSIATGDGLANWFPASAEVVPGVGGRIVWDWGDAYRWPLTIDAWEAGERLMARYESGVEDEDGGKVPLFVEFLLEGEGGHTRLRLVHSGFGPGTNFDEEYDGISQGWPVELQSLKMYLEHHRGTHRQLAWARTSTPLAPDAAMHRLLGDDGIRLRPAINELEQGAPFVAQLGPDAPLECTVASSPTAIGLCGTSRALDHAFFHAHTYHHPQQDTTHVWLWLAQYNAPAERVGRYQTAMDATLRRAFASSTSMTTGAVA